MTTNPTNIHEAHALLLAAIMKNPPHNIRYEANEIDWDNRIAHLQKIGNALDAYLTALGRDCASHARSAFDMKCFTDPVSDALDDALGQMALAREAAYVTNTLPAE